MAKTSKPTAITDPARKQAVVYARVSSKEQEKEGFSIRAQLKLLREYAVAQGFTVEQEYVDVETAKQTGRAAFGEMVAYLKAHPSVRVMLVEKTDRLYRNLKDWVTVDELEVEIHFPKEGVVLSRESRSSEKFMHGIKVLMAKNYIDNLSEEARKGMQEKAEQGIWPTVAPLGYRNVAGSDGKKTIEPDPDSAPLIARLFEWYATGALSLKEAAEKARAAGLVYRKSGAPVPVSTVHTTLRNRLYTGEFEWNGHVYLGKHQPLVTRELWERVQGVLDGRHAKKNRLVKHDFAFSGLIICGHCGCSIVGEIKKQRYVYYHCTGYKGRCDEPYVREEVIEQQFTDLLGRLKFELDASHADERREHEDSIERLRPNTTDFRTAFTPCTWTSSMEGWMASFSNGCQVNGAESRIVACARSNGTRLPTSPTSKKVCGLRTGAERAAAIRKARTARKAPFAQFSSFELLMEGWRANHGLAPTV